MPDYGFLALLWGIHCSFLSIVNLSSVEVVLLDIAAAKKGQFLSTSFFVVAPVVVRFVAAIVRIVYFPGI